MSTVCERTKHKAQVYDVALNAFFKARALDAESLGVSRREVGWDIAEAMVAAAISGVTYKSRDPATLAEAALLLRELADQVEHDGLADLSWGYRGDMLTRHAWRPDIRTAEGLEDLDLRTDAIIGGMMGITRSLSVADKRVIVSLSFARMALEHVRALIDQHPDSADVLRAMTVSTLTAGLEDLQAAPGD